MWRIVAVAPDDPASALSGGMYVPASRKDLMFDIRSRDDAEGESSIIGSGRRDGFFGSETRDDVLDATEMAAVVPVDDGGWAPGRGRLRPRKISAVLRMWEKSWRVDVSFFACQYWHMGCERRISLLV